MMTEYITRFKNIRISTGIVHVKLYKSASTVSAEKNHDNV